MNTAEILEECRERWDRPENRFAVMQAKIRRHRDFNVDCQGESIPTDRIGDYRTLLEQGRTVWGAVVQASGELFMPGTTDLPAYLVYGQTQYYTKRPEALLPIASRLYSLKEEELDEEDERIAVIAGLSGDVSAPRAIPLPLSVTAGHTGVFLGTAIIHRRRLPTGRLTAPGLPVIVCPERTQAVMVLPLRYWSPNLVRWWHEEEIAAVGKQTGSVRVTGLMAPPSALLPQVAEDSIEIPDNDA